MINFITSKFEFSFPFNFSDFDFSFFTFDIFCSYILSGLLFSVFLTIFATILGLIFGTLLAMMRLSSMKLLSWLAIIYITAMRSIPLVMVILWFFVLLPFLTGTSIGANKSALITFTAFETAYFAEIMRAGINSVAQGQKHAGQALGMTYWQNMYIVILPQAFRDMLPVFLTQVIILFQDTTLVYAISGHSLLNGFDIVANNFGVKQEAYILAAIFYFVICFTLSQIVVYLQKKISIIR
ncbi:His/Glu/Gln/Arg/opine family amino ABC transporter, permease, 3-TM region [Bartonella vinsonii subsp. arupensis OK-94-513]|uniref:Glutamate/aspartate import permease protein GltK n=2 Tax=Bartonella vinsonii subsp. arupensis TaxID=110578 RepID=J0R576_BARVI|nr:amino acid ABC transporter permease [Bartonella vinsonii]EJF90834.1 His/Glu/Gln/Arg/opine family amino ABC transporter, permease, 3-TM region [Bartonella vinsonii subsp. arupensis OK-94-513]EJF97590.1 His/Glu/Gln/Arg/opine family amino ABC transporter, permease, 3-TM region [Bartonella vinsonii subsp. arupensis Pm136co]